MPNASILKNSARFRDLEKQRLKIDMPNRANVFQKYTYIYSICMQTDLEEAKGHEIIKLQNSLQAMQSKLDETNELLVNEREAARKAIEEAPPVIKETPVVVQDTEKIDSLTAEVQQLKVIELKPLKVPSMSWCL